MKFKKFNDTASDADIRDRRYITGTSVWADGRLNCKENLVSKNLKLAHDAYDREQRGWYTIEDCA